MKPIFHRLVLASLLLSFGASCTTAYDQYGRPRQVVEPAAALIGVAAVGLLAYGLANNNSNRRNGGHNGCSNGYSGYRGGYGGRYY